MYTLIGISSLQLSLLGLTAVQHSLYKAHDATFYCCKFCYTYSTLKPSFRIILLKKRRRINKQYTNFSVNSSRTLKSAQNLHTCVYSPRAKHFKTQLDLQLIGSSPHLQRGLIRACQIP